MGGRRSIIMIGEPRSAVDANNHSTGGARTRNGLVNTATKVYHHEGDPWYGKTKHGKYMTKSEAIRAGNRAAKK